MAEMPTSYPATLYHPTLAPREVGDEEAAVALMIEDEAWSAVPYPPTLEGEPEGAPPLLPDPPTPEGPPSRTPPAAG